VKDTTLAQGNQVLNLILQKQLDCNELQRRLIENKLFSSVLDAVKFSSLDLEDSEVIDQMRLHLGLPVFSKKWVNWVDRTEQIHTTAGEFNPSGAVLQAVVDYSDPFTYLMTGVWNDGIRITLTPFYRPERPKEVRRVELSFLMRNNPGVQLQEVESNFKSAGYTPGSIWDLCQLKKQSHVLDHHFLSWNVVIATQEAVVNRNSIYFLGLVPSKDGPKWRLFEFSGEFGPNAADGIVSSGPIIRLNTPSHELPSGTNTLFLAVRR
jgi:hypothetical protein